MERARLGTAAGHGATASQSAACAADQTSFAGLAMDCSHDWSGDNCLPRYSSLSSICGRNENARLQISYWSRHSTDMVHRGAIFPRLLKSHASWFEKPWFCGVAKFYEWYSVPPSSVANFWNTALDLCWSFCINFWNIVFVVFCNQVIAVLIPFLFFLAYYVKRRSMRDLHNAMLGEYWVITATPLLTFCTWRVLIYSLCLVERYCQ